MLAGTPKIYSSGTLSCSQQKSIPLPSFTTAFPNRFGAIKSYDSSLWTASDTKMDDKGVVEFSTDSFPESGNSSTKQLTVQQELTNSESTTSRKYFICKYCGKKMTSRRNWKGHERIHENVKPFACEVCEKTFRMRIQLKEHGRIHTNEKPLVCPECGMCFRQRSVLYSHKAVHKDTMDHKCSVCFKEFRLKSTLINHSYTHPTVKPYRCTCGKGFTSKWNLGRHLRKETCGGHYDAAENAA